MCVVTLKPLHLHKRGKQGGGRQFRKYLTLIYCFYCMLRTCPRSSYQALITCSWPLACFDVDSETLVVYASGGVGGVLAALTTMVKECNTSIIHSTPSAVVNSCAQSSTLHLQCPHPHYSFV